MANGQISLAYTIKGGIRTGVSPSVVVGTGANQRNYGPSTSLDDSFWWYFLDNATQKILYGLQVPGSSNSTVPSPILPYMTNPNCFFGLVTQSLSTLHVPQGGLYNFLVNYGAGDALNMLEQINATLGSGYFR